MNMYGILICRLHVLANTEDNSDTGDLELIRHLHVNVSSLKILLQGRKYFCNTITYNLKKKFMNKQFSNNQPDCLNLMYT